MKLAVFYQKLDIFVVLTALAIVDAAALREFSLSTFQLLRFRFLTFEVSNDANRVLMVALLVKFEYFIPKLIIFDDDMPLAIFTVDAGESEKS